MSHIIFTAAAAADGVRDLPSFLISVESCTCSVQTRNPLMVTFLLSLTSVSLFQTRRQLNDARQRRMES